MLLNNVCTIDEPSLPQVSTRGIPAGEGPFPARNCRKNIAISERSIYRNVGSREENVEILNPGRPRRMTRTQVELVEHSLRYLTGIHRDDSWGTISVDLRRIFEK